MMSGDSNGAPIPVFDQEHAIALAEAKRTFLVSFLPELKKQLGLKTALDAGCGFGYFSSLLKDLGFEVTAFDGREENIAEASKRNPGVKFITFDVENSEISKLGIYSVVFCLGLLYHLENPFQAIRNLFSVTEKILIIETQIAPFKSQIAVLIEEGIGQDQSLNYVSLIPTESCFVKMLYKAGFPFVYRCSSLPKHKDFCSSILCKCKRTILIASKIELTHKILHLVQSPRRTNQYIWYKFGLSNILENKLLRKIVKNALKFMYLYR